MKKMTKMGIDALRENLPVLSQDEQRSCMGTYSSDSFWRCVAFLNSGDYSEAGAEEYALAWKTFQCCGDHVYAHNYLTDHGAGIVLDAAFYYLTNNDSGLFDRIALVDTRIDPNGYRRYVVLLNQDSDGSYRAFDPNCGDYFTVSPNELTILG